MVQPLTRCLAFACCLILAGADLGATDLTGTFHRPDGTPVNGKLIFLLSQPTRLADGSAQVVPIVKIFQVTNGQLEPGAFIYGNDVLVPAGTHYLVRLVDNSNNLLFEQKWFITGESLDLGTLTPTTVGVVLVNPLVTNSDVEQAVEGPVTFTSPVTAFSLTLNGDLNPGAPGLYSLGSTTAPWREVVADGLRLRGGPWFDIMAFGAKCDNVTDDWPALVAAYQAAVAAGGGVVVVPPQASQDAVCRMSGGTLPGTFSNGQVRPVTIKIQANIRLENTIGPIGFRHLHLDCSQGQSPHGGFSPHQMARITGDAGVSPLIHYRASTALAPANPAGTGGEERTTNSITRCNLVPAADADGIWIIGTQSKQAEWIIMDGIRIAATGNGIPLWIDSALWIWLKGHWVIQASQASVNPGVKITNDGAGTSGSGTGLLHFIDGIIVGRGFYWTDAQSQPSNGDIVFSRITSESLTSPFFTYDSTTGSTLSGLKFDHIETADTVTAGPLIAYPANVGAGAMENVEVNNASGNKDNFRIVEGKAIQNLMVHVDLKARGLYGGVNQIGQSGAGTIVRERSGRLALGGTNSGNGSGENPALLSLNPIGVKLGASTGSTSPAAKANLHISDGTGAGDLGSLGGNVIAYFESSNASNTDVMIASPSGNGRIRFGRPGAAAAGVLAFSHASDRWLLQTAGLGDVLRISASEEFRVNQQIRWLNNTSFEGRLAHANTAARTYTFPDFSGSVGVIVTATTSLDFPEIAPASTAEMTITVSGTATGDSCTATPNGAPESGLLWSCYVSGANTVVVRLGNITGVAINPAARTWRATAWKP